MRYDQVLETMQTTCVCGGDWFETPEEAGCTVDEAERGNEDEHRPVLARSDTEWRICERCRGEGTLRGYPGVYTQEDFADDPDFYEDYMSHRRECEDCRGTGKIRDLTDAAHERPEVQEWLDDWHETENIYRMERMYGA